ncbi:TBC1 domain family member 31 isoform X2 [Pseudomyrmex gracilis]|uniref:TBC1 domain family member 31 isoform X2 n=1 Tax=Pseudomyrmex gracilis TaxID=219809 RepID=UPI0009951059|nr:TBC1 domain family member 31 isoform X2 [Pseudomyrmex gracilis]
MRNNEWIKLTKRDAGYKYELRACVRKDCTAAPSFTQMAFDHDEELMIAIDAKGYLHCIDLSDDTPCYKRSVKIGQATFVAFNPAYKGELLMGLDSGNIKIWKLHTAVDKFILLPGHKLTPTRVSFYKNEWCLTSSRNEAIIWHLPSYGKAYQLKVDAKNAVIKKAAFSNAGHIVVLYHNDTVQTWTFGQLDKDIKIDAKILGMRLIVDFIFTRDGKAVITVDRENISVVSTCTWHLLKRIRLPKNFTAKQLCAIPCSLNDDKEIAEIVGVLSRKCVLHFCNINASSFLETSRSVDGIKKVLVSFAGKYIAHINLQGCLNVTRTREIVSRKYRESRKSSEPRKVLCAHKTSDHLEFIRQRTKRELNIKRLMAILKEFGEYPKKYRVLIWSTILKLPSNKNAYVALVNKAIRNRFMLNSLKSYPLADRSKRSLLIATMDCLAHWCPTLMHASFLPNLIFPFLIVFQKDPLLGFELILCILLNYCYNWFEYHPLPPLNILGIIENILLEADPALLNTFCKHGIATSVYAWPLLRTTLSEVLSGNEWLILWDHLITFQKPSVLLMCVVAYCIYSRETIISLLKSSGSVETFFGAQGNVRAKDILNIAKRLDRELPERLHPDCYIRNKLLRLNDKGSYPMFLKDCPNFLSEELTNTQSKEIQN